MHDFINTKGKEIIDVESETDYIVTNAFEEITSQNHWGNNDDMYEDIFEEASDRIK